MHDLLGFLAAACTTLAFVPQAIRVWSTKSAEDVSLFMYVVMLTGVVLWIVYGLSIGSRPLVMANIVSLVLVGAVLVGKLRAAPGRA